MRVLAIAAHPDDIEISCAGTLARYKKMGWDVFMCHVSNGNQGHAVIMPDELRAIRRKEFLIPLLFLGPRDLPVILMTSVSTEICGNTGKK